MTDTLLPAVPGDPDDEDRPKSAEAVYADITADRAGELRPVIPEAWRRGNVGSTVRLHARRHSHVTAYHGLRAPVYGAKTAGYAVRGAGVLTVRLLRWWHWTEGWVLESQAVAAGRAGHQHAMSAHTQGLKTRGQRGRILAVCTGIVLVGGVAMWHYLPHWSFALLAVAVFAVLVRHGKPEGKPLFESALSPPQYEKPSREIITAALGSVGLAGIDRWLRDGREVAFVAPGVGRDGPGWRVMFDLPFGVTAGELIERRDKFASGLRRPAGCVWPEGDNDEHPGRVNLYICDEPLSKMRQPAWPLAKAGKADIFQPIPFGTDQRGKPVTVTLMFANMLIGAISRMGKTVAMRNLLLAAALDPTVEVHVWELKGTGDLGALKHVAHAYGSGADDETFEACLADVRKVHALLDKRAKVIKELHEKGLCPENKVTPQLAARRSLGLHPVLLAIDECQEPFSHPDFKDELEKLCLQIIRRGPALGIMLGLATQRPDAKSLPTAITANVALRFCLKVMDDRSNNMILGTGAYARGINATLLAFSDKGIGWAMGFSDAPMILKSYYPDGAAAERICQRARRLREDAGRLSGYAAGEVDGRAPRSFAADVLSVFGKDANLWSETIAERLAERHGDVYAGITRDAVASQLRKLGVPVKDVREAGKPNRKGAARDDVAAVAGDVDGFR